MKSVLSIKEDEINSKVEFPCFYRNKGNPELVVLFMHLCCGIVVNSGSSGFKVGHWSVTWQSCTDENIWDRLGVGTEVTLTQD